MTRRLVPVLALAAVLACRESEPQPLEVVVTDPFGDGKFVAGGGASEFLAYTRYESSVTSVRLLRHDAARPDELEALGDIVLGDVSGEFWRYGCLFASGGFAVVCDPGSLRVIDLANPANPPISVPWTFPDPPDDLAIGAGRVLLASTGSTLFLIDLDDQARVATFTSPSPVTSVVEAQALTFLAFTTTGYVSVWPSFSPSWPMFVIGTDPDRRNFRRAFYDGLDTMMAAGPAKTLGRVRVVRLNGGTPGTIVSSIEVDGEYAAFAWDGAGTSVVAVADATWQTIRAGYVVRESGGGLTTEGIPLPWASGAAPIAAHGDRLFVGYGGGFTLFRMR